MLNRSFWEEQLKDGKSHCVAFDGIWQEKEWRRSRSYLPQTVPQTDKTSYHRMDITEPRDVWSIYMYYNTVCTCTSFLSLKACFKNNWKLTYLNIFRSTKTNYSSCKVGWIWLNCCRSRFYKPATSTLTFKKYLNNLSTPDCIIIIKFGFVQQVNSCVPSNMTPQ